MKKKRIKLLFYCLLMGFSQNVSAQLATTALAKITTLQGLISQAETQGLDVTKEKMTVRTAQVFLKYANWDASHISENEALFGLTPYYSANKTQMANSLPDFERTDVITILDEAIATTNKLINHSIVRKPTPQIDWATVSIRGDQLIHNNKPVFLADYTWKPEDAELTDYYGKLDGIFIAPNHVQTQSGTISANILNQITAKGNGLFGNMFLGQTSLPAWLTTKYPDLQNSQSSFTKFDIDHPGAREVHTLLFQTIAPLVAGKKFNELGYILTNEPHWNTAVGTWDVVAVTPYTKAKFKIWLTTKHGTIANLNQVWGTNYADFDAVIAAFVLPVPQNLRGTPQWYDWMRFNNDRVTDWFTFLHDEIQKYAPTARTHIKLIPEQWSGNKVDHGLDFEALTRLTEVIGNDAKAYKSLAWGTSTFQNRYAFSWNDMAMSYDFFKSISPDKINFNSETHYLSATAFRDLYLKPSYVRAIYWLAHLQGQNFGQTWLWGRNADGSIQSKANDDGFPGTCAQQPKVVNELAATMLDINSHAEDIAALQHLRKPLRIFYSETSKINKTTHMDDVFSLYESLYFKGSPIGFATKNIILEQNSTNWDAILVYKTEFVTLAELNALQQYLNNGGTVIVDNVSLKKDEYGRNHTVSLTAGTGALLSANTLATMTTSSNQILITKNRLPKITLSETNNVGLNGCLWRGYTSTDGRDVISIINLGKSDATVSLNHSVITNAQYKNLLTGETVQNQFVMKPEEVFLLEIKGSPLAIDFTGKDTQDIPFFNINKAYPNPVSDILNIPITVNKKKAIIEVYNLQSQLISSAFYDIENDNIQMDMKSLTPGAYLLKIKTGHIIKSIKVIKY